MGYRFEDIKPPDPQDLLPHLVLTNGEYRRFSFPCFYFNIERPLDWHDPKFHDFIGWPRPDKPDHICQRYPRRADFPHDPADIYRYIDMELAVPIHLLSEYEGYYNGVELLFDDDSEMVDKSDPDPANWTYYYEWEGGIRPAPEDWIVEIVFRVYIPEFTGEPKHFPFNAYLSSDQQVETEDRHDLLMRAVLTVLPSNVPADQIGLLH